MLSTYSFTCMMIAVNNSWFVVSVTEGEVSFKLKVSAEIAPDVQIVAYAVLPSETVIAHSADFSTEKCFSNKVSIRRRLVVLTVLVRSRCRFKRYISCISKGQYVALQDSLQDRLRLV